MAGLIDGFSYDPGYSIEAHCPLRMMPEVRTATSDALHTAVKVKEHKQAKFRKLFSSRPDQKVQFAILCKLVALSIILLIMNVRLTQKTKSCHSRLSMLTEKEYVSERFVEKAERGSTLVYH